jgi:hypothetical protein
MFSRKVKIKEVTSCSSGDFLFVFGLGHDGRMYIWNAIQEKWLPHVQTITEPPAPEETSDGKKS